MSAQVTEAHIARARASGYTTDKGVQMAAQFIANNEAAKAERDQLRAECNNLRADLDAIKAIRDEETARAERAEAELKKWSLLNLWGGTPEIIHAFVKGQQARIHATQDVEAELAAERARLDWLLSRMGGNVLPANGCVAWTVDVYHYKNQFPSRAAIDAAMKEGA